MSVGERIKRSRVKQDETIFRALNDLSRHKQIRFRPTAYAIEYTVAKREGRRPKVIGGAYRTIRRMTREGKLNPIPLEPRSSQMPPIRGYEIATSLQADSSRR